MPQKRVNVIQHNYTRDNFESLCQTGKHTDYIISKRSSVCYEMRTVTSQIKIEFLKAAFRTYGIKAAAVELAG